MQELAKGGTHAAHRPEEPRHRLFAATARFRQQHAGLLRDVHKDRAGLEGCPWAAHAVVVDDSRYLSIRRDCEKPRRVLLARTEVYEVDRVGDAHLLEHYRRLRPVGRGPSEQLNHRAAFLVLSSRDCELVLPVANQRAAKRRAFTPAAAVA